jgi:hypothetical protein
MSKQRISAIEYSNQVLDEFIGIHPLPYLPAHLAQFRPLLERYYHKVCFECRKTADRIGRDHHIRGGVGSDNHQLPNGGAVPTDS